MGAKVPVVVLRSLKRRLGKAPTRRGRVSTDASVPLLSWYRQLSQEELGRILDKAGDERFFAKGRRFGQALRQEGSDQVLYGAILDALGYSQHREPFQALARTLSWRVLQQEALLHPPPERREALEALLLGCAGLLPLGLLQESEVVGAGMQRYARRLVDRWQALESPPSPITVPWERFRVRPGNHPLRRLVGAAALLVPHLEKGLAAGMGHLLQESGRAKRETGLRVPAYGPWVGFAPKVPVVPKVGVLFLKSNESNEQGW